MTIYKTRLVEALTNEESQKQLDKQKKDPILQQSNDTIFLDALAQSNIDYDITPQQLEFLRGEASKGKLNITDNITPFLLQNSLYGKDRLRSVNNFQYTVRILERIIGDGDQPRVLKQLVDFYGIDANADYTFQNKQMKPMDIMKSIIDTIYNNGDILSSQSIYDYIETMDDIFDTAKQPKEDWSRLRKDIEKLSARIYELDKNERAHGRFQNAEEQVKQYIETLSKAADDAMKASDNK